MTVNFGNLHCNNADNFENVMKQLDKLDGKNDNRVMKDVQKILGKGIKVTGPSREFIKAFFEANKEYLIANQSYDAKLTKFAKDIGHLPDEIQRSRHLRIKEVASMLHQPAFAFQDREVALKCQNGEIRTRSLTLARSPRFAQILAELQKRDAAFEISMGHFSKAEIEKFIDLMISDTSSLTPNETVAICQIADMFDVQEVKDKLRKRFQEATPLENIRTFLELNRSIPALSIEPMLLEVLQTHSDLSRVLYLIPQADQKEFVYILENRVKPSKAAKEADPQYHIALAICRLHGIGCRQKEVIAYTVLQKLAEAGDYTAKFWQGRCLYEGRGIQQDPKLAWKLILSAAGVNEASKGPINFTARVFLVNFFDVDEKVTKVMLKDAAKAKHPEGLYYYSQYLKSGFHYDGPREKNIEEALKRGFYDQFNYLESSQGQKALFQKLIRKAADAGDPESLYFLGISHIYADRRDQEADLKKAAESGHPKAQLELGKRRWERHDIDASTYLARVIANSRATKKDKEAAEKLLAEIREYRKST